MTPQTPPFGLRVLAVDPEGHAARIGIPPGARLVAINGSPVRDELDLLFLAADPALEIDFLDPDGVSVSATCVKHPDEGLGLEVEPLEPRRCRNRCVFCFVEQNPPGLRPALRVKDEDFRLSFTHGHYVTGPSLTAADLERIGEQRLSPLYLSVHAARHDLRCRMLGIPPESARDVLDLVDDLARRRIECHAQIVLCPGWNDGVELDRTLDALAARPSVLSVAVVPVGLTGRREGLTPLHPVTPEAARGVVGQVLPRQAREREAEGFRRTLLADEFYLLAGLDAPDDYDEEERTCQIENGVGMVQTFWRGWARRERRLRPRPAGGAPEAHVLTGLLGAGVLAHFAERWRAATGDSVQVHALENKLFGSSVTVAGLLAGRDFLAALEQLPAGATALLPADALRPGDDLFLDDLTLGDLRAARPDLRIEAVEGGAVALADALEAAPA